MRSTLILILSCLAGSSGCGVEAEATAAEAGAPALNAARTWGAGVSDGELTPVSRILADPSGFVGRTVRVEGTVVAVCPHRGCWLSMASDSEGETLRFRVKDGEMVFGPEVVGETLRAEGVFTANEQDLETTKQACRAEAEAAGEAFDESSVTECRTVYQVSGTGAVQLVAVP